MFVGRQRELATLESCYGKGTFQMIVLYGRRRVGKTTLLNEFAKGKRTLFFTAQEQSDKDNLADFSRQIGSFFDLPGATSFPTWDEALDYLADKAAEDPFLLIFDEFPYAALANPSLPSKLQIAIDHRFLQTGLCLVLCGSNQGFMESDVLGKKSPLHGRRTAQIKLEPFGYEDAAQMLGNPEPEDAFKYYACVGGVPYYLSLVDTDLTFAENMRALYFDSDGYLYGEPAMLLRQELREPALYGSILRAIAHGANRQSQIADRTGIPAGTLPRYLGTLRELGIVERAVPFGEDPETSRRGIYRLRDACYAFWYRFVAPAVPDIESGAGELAAQEVTEAQLSEYLGHRFERVCLEWLRNEALAGQLPVAATSVGSWWGTDPVRHEQTDIDVIAADRRDRTAIIGECKYRNSLDETRTIETLLDKRHLLAGYDVRRVALFSKNPAAQATREKYADEAMFISLEDLYGGE